MKKVLLFLCGLLIIAGAANAETIDFEDLTLEPESYWVGSDGEEGFESGFAEFNHFYDEFDWGFAWYGFAYSNRTDTEAIDYINSVGPEGGDFNAITGGGQGESEIYAVVYYSEEEDSENPTIVFDEEREIAGAFFTNNNISYYSMKEGDDFAEPFDQSDWLRVTVIGYDKNNEETADYVFFLAEDGEIVDEWEWVELDVLGSVKKLEFEMSSSQPYTPFYFCMDGLAAASPVDEDPEDEDPADEDPDDDDDSSSSDTCFIKTVGSGLF